MERRARLTPRSTVDTAALPARAPASEAGRAWVTAENTRDFRGTLRKYDTILTRQCNAGVDPFAARHTRLRTTLCVVECKRRKSPIGPTFVRDLVWVVERHRATRRRPSPDLSLYCRRQVGAAHRPIQDDPCRLRRATPLASREGLSGSITLGA